MEGQENNTPENTTVNTVEKPNGFECYLGNVGLTLTGYGKCLEAMREEHPIWGPIATPFYMYYATMLSPVQALFMDFGLYRQYKAEYAKNENADLDIDADWVGWSAMLRRNKDVAPNQLRRQAPKPSTLKKIGIGTLIAAGLLILGMLGSKNNEE